MGDINRANEQLSAQREELAADPELYNKLVPGRNRAWAKKIDALLRGRKTAVIMVGFGHFPGKDGLLQLLRDAGYMPVQMYGVDLRIRAAEGEYSAPGETSGKLNVNTQGCGRVRSLGAAKAILH